MNNDLNEFTRQNDNDNSLNNEIDQAFLEYGSDDEEEKKIIPEPEESFRKDIDHDEDNNDEYIANDIRCSYCGIVDTKQLVKCNEKDCQRWFCNGKADDYSASHIVFHLTKSKHKEIYVGDQSQVGEMILECYNCSSKNIFLLGFLESKEGDSGFILCREPCLTTSKIEDDKFDKTKWTPLINDKKLMEWLVPPPSDNDLRLCQRVNIRSISKLEEKWEKDKIKLSEEKPKFLEKFLKSVKLCYNDGQDYLETFEPLVAAEEEYDRKLKESQKKYNVKATFSRQNRRLIARFLYPREDNGK
jgi:regulator of nonsense transcripts 1